MSQKVAKIREDGKVLEVFVVPARSEDPLEIPLEEGAAVEPGRHRWTGAAFVELPFCALLLDEDDVLEAVVELASSAELTPQHVDMRPHGNACDWKPGLVRWDREKQTLVPLKFAQVKHMAGAPSLEAAFHALLAANPQLKIPSDVMIWQAGYRASVDAAKKKKGK
jgi:hypothetical protein